MDRRAFLLGSGALLLVGCAKVQPTSSSSLTPSTSSSASLPVIGVEQTPAGSMVGALLAGALSGQAVVQTAGSDWSTLLDAGTLSSSLVFAETVWAALSDSDEPPDDLMGDVAGLVGPKAGVLAPGATDGGLIWMAAASAGRTSLDGLAKWSKGKTAAVPTLAIERADGVSALNTIYGTAFGNTIQDDPVARAQLVISGQAGVAAFRRTEYLGGAALVELADPDKMCASDPLALLVNAAFADHDPEQVLAMSAVIQALTNAELNSLQQQVAQGAAVGDVAHQWLAAKSLIR